MIKIKKLTCTCTACPSQWEGRTDDNREIYIRYRYGHLSVRVAGERIFQISHGDDMDGVMDFDTLKELTKDIIEFS